jgi:hypothetical protein
MERSLSRLAGPFWVVAPHRSVHAADQLLPWAVPAVFQTPDWVFSNSRLISIVREKSLKFGAIWAHLQLNRDQA